MYPPGKQATACTHMENNKLRQGACFSRHSQNLSDFHLILIGYNSDLITNKNMYPQIENKLEHVHTWKKLWYVHTWQTTS
jgi:hypothetical protein